MKKVLKVLSIILLIISILLFSIIVVANLVTIIRILFFGMTVGSDYPDTIWWERTTLRGLAGIKTYYHVWGELVYMFEIPMSIVCILYQIVYFKIIRKKLKSDK